MKRRIAVGIFLVMLGTGLVGFAIGANELSTINGPGLSGFIGVSNVTFNNASMNWGNDTLTLTLTSTGAISGTCSATFTPSGSIAVPYSFTGPSTASFRGSTTGNLNSTTSIGIRC